MFLFYYFLYFVNLLIVVILFMEDFVCLLFLYMVDWKVLSFVLILVYICIFVGNNYVYIDNIGYFVIFY